MALIESERGASCSEDPIMKFGRADGGGRRCAQRTTAPLDAVVTTLSDRRSYELVDLSASGVRLTGAERPSCGDELEISVERVRAYGTVVWSENGQCGIEFDEPIDPQVVAAIRQQVLRAKSMRPVVKAALDDWTTGLAR